MQRRTIAFGLAAAWSTAFALPRVSSAQSDNELIGLCRQLIGLEARFEALHEGCRTLRGEKDIENQADDLMEKIQATKARITGLLPPRSLDGAVATAKVTLASPVYGPDGRMVSGSDFHERLAYNLARFMATADTLMPVVTAD